MTSKDTNNDTINQDELIIEQQRKIEREIAGLIPLIGPKEGLDNLHEEYASDGIYLKKVADLESKYHHMRKTRPDGNCFFRAFTFAYMESLLNDKEECERFKKIAEASKENLIALGFSKFTLEDFHEILMDTIQKTSEQITVEELEQIFNSDQGYSDYIVVYMRLLTSGQLQKQSEFFLNFLEGGRTIEEFCHQEVEPMYRESDHIHIIALTNALNVGVRVEYMDRGEGSHTNAHNFPENSQPRVFLLYRPGHYDILYP